MQLASYMGQSNTRTACTGLFDSPMLLVLMAQSHATRTDGTVPCIYAYGTVPCVLYAYGTVPYAYGTVPYTYIAIIIYHPVPSNFTGILWHWIIYFTSNNIQTPMNMYYLTVTMDLCPNKHATKATTAISVV